MIVDCHTHLKFPQNEIDIAEHLDACEKVDTCIILASFQDDLAGSNKAVSKFVNQYRKMTGFGVANPIDDKINRKSIMAFTRDMNLKGIVLYCAENNFHPAHSQAMLLYELAEEHGLPVFFHNAVRMSSEAALEYTQPYQLDEIARKFPSLKIIVGNMGLPFLQQTLYLIAKHENVYADLSISPKKAWEVFNIVLSTYEAEVMDKLFFGSNYPLTLPGNCIETLLGFNKLMAEANLPTVPRERIRNVIERDTLALLGIIS